MSPRGEKVDISSFQSYSKYYDMIYHDKDYEKEVDFLGNIFRRYSKITTKTMLDAGCGTGGHAIPLAKRGYDVSGIDVSEIMVEIAREKAEKSGVDISFNVMDIRDFQLGQKFDACICMFAVIDYIADNKALEKVFLNIRNHLKKSGLFIFDFWYGPAVLTILPSARRKIMKKDDIKIIRFAEPALDILHHICEVNYHVIVIKGKEVIDEIEEKHIVRYFFPQEIKYFLEKSGFKLVKLCKFLELDVEPNKESWNVVAITQAV